METLTELVTADRERVERAYRYETATRALDNVQRRLPKCDAPIAYHAKQVALIDKAIAAIEQIDGALVGKGGFRAQGVILSHLHYVKDDQARRLAETTAKRDALQAQLPSLEKAVADFA